MLAHLTRVSLALVRRRFKPSNRSVRSLVLRAGCVGENLDARTMAETQATQETQPDRPGREPPPSSLPPTAAPPATKRTASPYSHGYNYNATQGVPVGEDAETAWDDDDATEAPGEEVDAFDPYVGDTLAAPPDSQDDSQDDSLARRTTPPRSDTAVPTSARGGDAREAADGCGWEGPGVEVEDPRLVGGAPGLGSTHHAGGWEDAETQEDASGGFVTARSTPAPAAGLQWKTEAPAIIDAALGGFVREQPPLPEEDDDDDATTAGGDGHDGDVDAPDDVADTAAAHPTSPAPASLSTGVPDSQTSSRRRGDGSLGVSYGDTGGKATVGGAGFVPAANPMQGWFRKSASQSQRASPAATDGGGSSGAPTSGAVNHAWEAAGGMFYDTQMAAASPSQEPPPSPLDSTPVADSAGATQVACPASRPADPAISGSLPPAPAADVEEAKPEVLPINPHWNPIAASSPSQVPLQSPAPASAARAPGPHGPIGESRDEGAPDEEVGKTAETVEGSGVEAQDAKAGVESEQENEGEDEEENTERNEEHEGEEEKKENEKEDEEAGTQLTQDPDLAMPTIQQIELPPPLPDSEDAGDDSDEELLAEPPMWSAYRYDGSGTVSDRTGGSSGGVSATAALGLGEKADAKPEPETGQGQMSTRMRKSTHSSADGETAEKAAKSFKVKLIRTSTASSKDGPEAGDVSMGMEKEEETEEKEEEDAMFMEDKEEVVVVEDEMAKVERPQGRQRRGAAGAGTAALAEAPAPRRGARGRKTAPQVKLNKSAPNANKKKTQTALENKAAIATDVKPAEKPKATTSKRSHDAAAADAPAKKRLRGGDDNSVRVLISIGFTDDQRQKFEAQIKKLNGKTTNSTADFTHFLTAPPLGRSKNVLSALAAGRHVVGESWISASMRANAFVSPEDHLCRHGAFERQHGFDLKRTLENARHAPVLAGLRVFIVPAAGKGRRSGSGDSVGAMLREVLPMAGAEMATGADIQSTERDELVSDRWLVVATGDSGAAEVGRLVKRGVPVHGHEAVLEAIIKHRLDRQAHVRTK